MSQKKTFGASLAAIKAGVQDIQRQLLEADAAINSLPNGRQKTAFRKALQPIWDQWFEPKAPPKPRRATWDFGRWKAEAIHQAGLAKTFAKAGRQDLARAAQKRADEAERKAKALI